MVSWYFRRHFRQFCSFCRQGKFLVAVSVYKVAKLPKVARSDGVGIVVRVAMGREPCQGSKILSTHSFVCGAR